MLKSTRTYLYCEVNRQNRDSDCFTELNFLYLKFGTIFDHCFIEYNKLNLNLVLCTILSAEAEGQIDHYCANNRCQSTLPRSSCPVKNLTTPMVHYQHHRDLATLMPKEKMPLQPKLKKQMDQKLLVEVPLG